MQLALSSPPRSPSLSPDRATLRLDRYRWAARPSGSTAGRMELLMDGDPERPPVTRTTLLRDLSGERAGAAVRRCTRLGANLKLCTAGPACFDLNYCRHKEM